jgi:hypothetical protein
MIDRKFLWEIGIMKISISVKLECVWGSCRKLGYGYKSSTDAMIPDIDRAPTHGKILNFLWKDKLESRASMWTFLKLGPKNFNGLSSLARPRGSPHTHYDSHYDRAQFSEVICICYARNLVARVKMLRPRMV